MADKFKKSDYLTDLETKNKDYLNAVENYGDFSASDALNLIEQKKLNAANAVTNYGDFSYKDQALLDATKNQLMNRDKFTYDLNGDALYQQYKDKYINQGRLAMQDTIGQASAMTGGYGNSYAATAGNQAYQASLQNLNDIVPQLYQMAYDQYVQEGQNLKDKYSLLSDDRSYELGIWGDKRNQLIDDRDYLTNEYNSKYNQEYGQYTDKYSMLRDLANLTENRSTNQYNQEYGAYRDTVSDSQWQQNFNESVRQFNESQKASSATQKFTMSSAQEDRLDEYLAMEDWAAADNYIEYLKELGMSESEATYWIKRIPASYWTPTANASGTAAIAGKAASAASTKNTHSGRSGKF